MPSYTLGEISRKLKGQLYGDEQEEIFGIASIEKAQEREITFLANQKYKTQLEKSRAGAVIIDDKAGLMPNIPYIKVKDAYYAFMQAFVLFNPPYNLLSSGIHPSAVIHEVSKIGKNTSIGANCYIGKDAIIGNNTQIFPNSVILNETELGESCLIHPSVTIRENCKIGNRVIIHSGAVIGSDGFGFAPFEGKYHKIPQVGKVVIEDDVEIGANTTIDRATMGETVIKSGVKLDNLVQIAHNVVIGENTVSAGQSGIAGSTTIGKNCVIAGQVGIVGHLNIGNDVKIGAQSGVRKNIPDGELFFGSPAKPILQANKIEAILKNLPILLKRIKQLEKQVEEMQK